MNLNVDALVILRHKFLLCLALLLTLLISSTAASAEVFACLTPFNVQLEYQSQDSAIISWSDFTSSGEFQEYEYTYHLANEDVDYESTISTNIKEATLTDLIPGRSYFFYVRTVCDDDIVTNFTSGFVFHTAIDNSQACDAYLVIPDNKCQSPTPYSIHVDQPGLQLGEDVFIKAVELTIQHDWPADLELQLISPNGISIPLFADFGVGSSHVGDISNPCELPLSLDMNACERISSSVPLIGSYKPIGDLELLYDGSSPNGDWTLQVCDDAQGQVGVIRFATILFVEMSCSGPDDLYFVDIDDTSLDIVVPEASCDSLQISYMEVENGSISTFYIPCSEDTITLVDLTPSTSYMLEFTPMCSGSIFSVSCPKLFETYCDSVDLLEDFTSSTNCNNGCDELCVVSSFWQNVGPAFWSINSGATGTVLTGPSADASGIGQYAYIESSDTLCRQSAAHLLSGCMTLIDTSDCNFGMNYHMYGNDISQLLVEISVDQLATWDTLWLIAGNQGDTWKNLQISLSSYHNETFQLRISTEYPNGNFGDIAIDNIRLSGIDLTPNNLVIYRDQDMDGYGSDDDFVSYCGVIAPEGFSFLNGDCDDNNPLINPGQIELPCNLIDDNCDGSIDEDGIVTLDYEIDQQLDQTCIGIENGQISVHAIGGNEPYVYQWLHNGSTDSITNGLGAGYYQVIISDAAGCMILSDSIEIQIIQQFDYLVTSIEDARCLGNFDGGIDIFHEESNGPYQYLWNTGDTTKDISNVGPGFYELTITDINNCLIETQPIEVLAEKTLIIDTDSIANVSCYGGMNGLIEISIDNGTLPLSYQWSTGSDQNSISSLHADTYSVSVSDGENCVQEIDFTITEPDVLTTSIIANDPVTCKGENNGKIQVQSFGGTAPYTYQWENGTTGPLNSELTAGIYRLDISDANNCLDSLTSIAVSEPDSVFIEILNVEPVICENNGGSIEISVSGGTGNYRYFWTDSISNGHLASGIGPGTYDITVLDAFDCKSTVEGIGVALLQTQLLLDTLAIGQLQCYGQSDAIASFQVVNPTSLPLSLIMDTDTIPYVDALVELDSLSSGLYTSEIRDNNGCTSGLFTFEVNQPDSMYVKLIEVEDNQCFGDSLGSIAVQTLGGSPTFQYSWSIGSVDSVINNLPANSYSVTVEDNNGCKDSILQIDINQPAILELDSINYQDLNCYGSNNGSIEVFGSGGTMPYQFSYNDIIFNGSLDQLPAGTYALQITDNYNCLEIFDTITLLQPDSISIEIDSLKASFCADTNGFIELNVNGGTGDFDYLWNDPLLDGASAQNLSAGEYSVTVQDERGCKDSLLNIQLDSLSKNITLQLPNIIDASCYEKSDGIIGYEIDGDNLVPPYEIFVNNEFFISSEDPEGFLTNLEQGDYTISVLEGDGCVDSLSNIQINSPSEILYNLSIVSPISCFGDSNAVVAISATGGVGEFEYLWSNQASGDTLFDMGPGLLAAAIVDGNNCVKFTDTILIAEPAILDVNIISFDATEDNNDGAIYIETSGGTAPYSYIWDPELPTHVDTLEALGESTWMVEVIDSRGCSFDTIIIIDRIVATEDFEQKSFALYPNPSQELLQVSSEFPVIAYEIIDVSGQIIRDHRLGESMTRLSIGVSDLYDGLYLLRLFDDHQKSFVKSFIKISSE